MPQSPGIDRRSVHKAALWSAPTVVLSAAAPASATSGRLIEFRSASGVYLNRYYSSRTNRTRVDLTISSQDLTFRNDSSGVTETKVVRRPAVTFVDLQPSDTISSIEITYLLPNDYIYYSDGFQFASNSLNNLWSPLEAGDSFNSRSSGWWGSPNDPHSYTPLTTTYQGPALSGLSGTQTLRGYKFVAEQKNVSGNSSPQNESGLYYYFRIRIKANGIYQERFGGVAAPPARQIPII